MKTKIRYNNDAQIAYEKAFNDKIDAFKSHKKYEWLRQYANDALIHHTSAGYLAIKAIDFMDKIIKYPLSEIKKWLDEMEGNCDE